MRARDADRDDEDVLSAGCVFFPVSTTVCSRRAQNSAHDPHAPLLTHASRPPLSRAAPASADATVNTLRFSSAVTQCCRCPAWRCTSVRLRGASRFRRRAALTWPASMHRTDASTQSSAGSSGARSRHKIPSHRAATDSTSAADLLATLLAFSLFDALGSPSPP
jgi:hypothetical protein